jgi:putative flippase GtrA
VTVVHGLYVRFRQIIHEFAKFGIIGVVGLAITNLGYALLHSHGVGPVTSTTIATIVATIVAYVGNRYWSFAHRERTNIPREGVTFFVLNGIGLLIQDAVVAFNSYVLHLEHHKLAEFIALNTGIAIATVFRFWSYRRFVWRMSTAGEAGTGAVPAPPAPSGQPSAAAGVPAAQPEAEQLSPAEADAGLPHQNGHGPAGQAARRGSFSRS